MEDERLQLKQGTATTKLGNVARRVNRFTSQTGREYCSYWSYSKHTNIKFFLKPWSDICSIATNGDCFGTDIEKF